MRLIDASHELNEALEAAGLTPTRLDPWEAWKVFKAFCRREVEAVYDCPAVHFTLDPLPEAGDRMAHILLVRQFSRWEKDASGEWADTSLGRVVVDLTYPARQLGLRKETELWSMDFRTLEEFDSVVEGNDFFQAGLSHEPVQTDVYFDPDFD
jgi:hypothetical protein